MTQTARKGRSRPSNLREQVDPVTMQKWKAEENAKSLSSRLEAVEKDKENQKRRAQQNRDDLTRYAKMHEQLKRELDVIEASANSV